MLKNTADRRQTFNTIRFLFPYLITYRWQSLVSMLAVSTAALATLMIGHSISRLVDGGLLTNNLGDLNSAIGLIFTTIIVLALSNCARFYSDFWIGERIAANLRCRVYDHLIHFSPEFFESAQIGDILSRLIGDVLILQNIIGNAVSPFIRNSLILLGSIAMLFTISATLAAYVVLVVPLVVAPIVFFGQRAKRHSRLTQDALGEINALAEETLNAVRTLQAFTREATASERFATTVEKAASASLRLARTRTILIFFETFVGLGAVTLGLWVGGMEVQSGRLTQGALSAFILYAVMAAISGGAIAALNSAGQAASGAADRLIELLREQPKIKSPQRTMPLPSSPHGSVAIERVTHIYPARPGHSALVDFSVYVERGETIALVGPSGAGKTTVFQLLLRFYDPTAGVVRIDGVDVKSADLTEIRKRIATVPQEPVIFGSDVWENIRYGRHEATDAEVRKAADSAGATEFIERLPKGFATFLGEKGIMLSGGQRQRIAIARAILRDAPILLLDEATSALDAESERAVQSALMKLASGRTTIVIAHRLATVRRASRIIVLDRGRQVATGTHESLIADGGLYTHLASLQFGTNSRLETRADPV
jgi:ATP-binding cassette subfamily B protein